MFSNAICVIGDSAFFIIYTMHKYIMLFFFTIVYAIYEIIFDLYVLI